ncbi:MAG: hypothetical protein WC661_18415 [Opitutaceae bacterium]
MAPSIIANSNMETDADADGRPDGWPAGGTWENEDGNHFIRLTSATPGSTVMLYREIGLPTLPKRVLVASSWVDPSTQGQLS